MLSEPRMSGSSSTTSNVGESCILFLPSRRRGWLRGGERHVECAALPRRALRPQLPAHRPHVAARDVQPQAGAPCLPAGAAMHLVEPIEDTGQLVFGNAVA